MHVNFKEVLKRAIKYLVEGLMVAICASILPKKSLDVEEIAILALTAAATFSILDTYIPSIGASTKNGVGLGLGLGLSGVLL